MRRVVGRRRARIGLDDETVDVEFGTGGALVVERPSGDVDGEGSTDRQTVLDLLDGYIEVGDAIMDGRLHVVGAVDEIAQMFEAIEILLDGAARIPPLQDLARDFRDDPCRDPRRPPVRRSRSASWHPAAAPPDELGLLERHDLL